jgi:hypothetical protein
MSEVPRRHIAKGWSRFVNGQPYPAFCWAKPFARVFEEVKARQPNYVGLAVAAIGEHEGDVAHSGFGAAAPLAIARALSHVVHGKLSPTNTGSEEFAVAYEELAQSTTGPVDVVVVKLHEDPDQSAVSHFGHREPATLRLPLDYLATTLSAEAGVCVLPTLPDGSTDIAAAL